ncbi:DUF3040 domain-containing protein [Georgenia sp. Z1344]|uniref:DUF3040 domain-containing protein n=1 Tax=Georgenia sp. Z1344 TaxID=3416706 RepID=UPI003CEC0406
MPLSDYEQRMLAQMEAQLHADDPRLAETLGDTSGPDLRKVALGALVAVVGIGGLVGGVATGWIWLGVLGFLAMVGGVLLAMTPSTRPARTGQGSPGAGPGGRGGRGGRGGPSSGGSGPSGGRTATSKSFMERQQEKWEQRGEGRGV